MDHGPQFPSCRRVPSRDSRLLILFIIIVHWHGLGLVFHVVLSPLYFKVSSGDSYILYSSIMDNEKT